jgi:hypothetical protein
MERIKSSDVLDVTHHTVSTMRGRVVGYFRRLGPNSWDDYGFVAEPGEDIELVPGVPVMLESRGAELRVRSKGHVVRVRFVPSEVDRPQLPEDASNVQLRRYLAEQVLGVVGEESTLGVSGVIAKKLGD